MSFHVMNICRRRLEHGDAAANTIIDLRGQLTRIFERAGFLMHSEVCVFRDPTQALIRTKAQGLFYRTFCNDAALARQALPDYVVTMRKPGINTVPIAHDPAQHSMEEWIRLACPAWFVKATNTLNVKKTLANAPGVGKATAAALLAELSGGGDNTNSSESANSETASNAGDDEDGGGGPEPAVEQTGSGVAGVSGHNADQKHPTPLQLEIIEKCVTLWSNPGETVMDPFSGIGSTTGFVCKQLQRKYCGGSWWTSASRRRWCTCDTCCRKNERCEQHRQLVAVHPFCSSMKSLQQHVTIVCDCAVGKTRSAGSSATSASSNSVLQMMCCGAGWEASQTCM